MNLIRKILLATDFLESSGNVLDNAIGLAKTFETEIALIHVLPETLGDEKAARLLRDAAVIRLAELKKLIEQKGVKAADPILESGVHFDKIVDAANRIDANMIVIGAGEKKDKDKYQLGTTAEKIIRKSSRPVLVIKRHQPFGIKTILCPVDGSKESARALKTAIIGARRFKAKLIILSVFESTATITKTLTHTWDAFSDYWAKNTERIKAQHLHKFNEFLEDFNLHDLDWSKEIAEGKPETEILSAIRMHSADLLIMGTTGRTGLDKMMMGSVTEKVVREVPCTFITTKKTDLVKLELETKIMDIEKHYGNGTQLVKDGFFEEAIHEFETCLSINDMHVPSINALAGIYEKMNRPETARNYKKMTKEVKERIWNLKIENEIRGTYRY